MDVIKSWYSCTWLYIYLLQECQHHQTPEETMHSTSAASSAQEFTKRLPKAPLCKTEQLAAFICNTGRLLTLACINIASATLPRSWVNKDASLGVLLGPSHKKWKQLYRTCHKMPDQTTSPHNLFQSLCKSKFTTKLVKHKAGSAKNLLHRSLVPWPANCPCDEV